MKSKLFYAFLGMAFVPLFAVGIFLEQATEKALSQSALMHLNSIASIQKDYLSGAILYYQHISTMIQNRTPLRAEILKYHSDSDPAQKESVYKIIGDAFGKVDTILGVGVFDANNELIAGTDNYANFDDICGEICITKLRDDDIHFDIIKDEHTGNAVVTVVGGIYFENAYAGSVVTYFDSGPLQRIFGNYDGLGSTGEVVIAKRTDNGSALIIHPTRFNPDATLVLTINDNNNAPMAKALNKEEGLFDANVVDYRNVPVLAATRYIELGDWGLVAKMDKSEVYELVGRVRLVYAFTLFAASVLSFLFAWYLSFLISLKFQP